MGLFGFMGSESKSTSTSQTITKPSDQRIGVEGGVGGQVIGPESTVAQNGIVARAGEYGKVTQNITNRNTGLAPADVRGILDSLTGSLTADRASERAATASMSSYLAGGLTENTRQLSQIVAAAKTPEDTTLRQLTPVLIPLALLFVLLIWGMK
jgi:hypothetical protein